MALIGLLIPALMALVFWDRYGTHLTLLAVAFGVLVGGFYLTQRYMTKHQRETVSRSIGGLALLCGIVAVAMGLLGF